MKYKLLGRSGLRVSELCLGTMTFGSEWGWGADETESRKVFDTYVKAGGNFIDTANLYTNGTSEKFVGKFIRDKREQFILATKYTLSMNQADPNASGNHRKNLVQAVEASLKRLDVDYIDLLWLHAWDYHTPLDEIMRALDDLVSAGKALYIGISDTPAWIVSQANMLADLRGWSPFIALQIEYSLIERTVERELIPMALSLDLAITPWGILGGGVLTGKYRQKNGEPRRVREGSIRLNERCLKIGDKVVEIAAEIDRSPSQVAINWLRQQHQQIIPILGARTAKQLKENLGVLDFELSRQHLDKLDKISEIDSGFPHRFLATEAIRKIVLGEKHDQIENHHRH